MRIVLISDTHGSHRELSLPDGDLLIHCGDFSGWGKEADPSDFLDWYSKQPFEFKILIAGNHDFSAANYPDAFEKSLPDAILYLNDSGTTIRGKKIWGSPVQPGLEGWAFGKKRGEEMAKHWRLIPEDTDILITHTPPLGVLDKSRQGVPLGCDVLLEKIKVLDLKLHAFGHIHNSYGLEIIDSTIYVNASNYDSSYGLINPPVVVLLD